MSDPIIKQIQELKPAESLRIQGLPPAAQAFFMARHLDEIQRPLCLITKDIKSALSWAQNFRVFRPKITVSLFPDIDVLPYYNLSPNPDIILQRLKTLAQNKTGILIAPFKSIIRKTMPRGLFSQQSLHLSASDLVDRDELVKQLTTQAYQRVGLVEDPGTFAVRGGILDIFPVGHEHPCRLEFFGDEIEKIRTFDENTQKSISQILSISISPAREHLISQLPANWKSQLKKRCDDLEIPKGERDAITEKLEQNIHFNGIESYTALFYPQSEIFLDYISGDSLILFEEKEDLAIIHDKYLFDLSEHQAKSTSLERIFNPTEIFASPAELKEYLDYFPQINFSELASSEGKCVHYDVQTNEHLSQKLISSRHHESSLTPLASELNDRRDLETHIFITAGTASQKERIVDLLSRYELPLHHPSGERATHEAINRAVKGESPSPQIQIIEGSLENGFDWPDQKQLWITDAEIFGNKTRRRRKSPPPGDSFSSFAELIPGDFIVHENHGIGIYKELVHMEVLGREQDFLLLEYLGGDKLYVPVDQLNKIYRYRSQEGHHPILDKMGGTSWKKIRDKVKKATRKLAKQLLEIQAKRQAAKGYSFTHHQEMYEEFEATFPYEETDDQLRAIEEVITDMSSTRPMDRLICGDVGYGKTEIALRAAYNAVLNQKQVCVLVPTTVLAFQHFETFKRRFDQTATNIKLLSRFQKPAEQKIIIEELKKGKIDIVVGTHRLLSKDIKFNDLGLLVIDEEHRFGVDQKEKIKKLKNMVDVLTLSATPIPRTLNFALTGIRDLSLINTPPADRLAIRTYVTHFDEGAIREAVLHEIKRGGQVYFVHNRVQTINGIRDKLQKILPEVTMAVAHGQMPEEDLEKVMVDFMNQKFQILICSTIIESGLDIPTANTMIINRADHLGLAQLYQLRGRVGRSHHRAYCYLLIPSETLITDVAKKRLKVIQRFTELGSGFKIASHDLELRGAGNILGAEQSGHIGNVGYDLYIQLLEEAVLALKGNLPEELVDPEIKLAVSATIPKSFIPENQLRLVLYKQLASVKDLARLQEVRSEWIDRFGSLPQETENLIQIMGIKSMARKLGILSIISQGKNTVFHISHHTPLPTDYLLSLVQLSKKDYKLLPDGKLILMGDHGQEEKLLKNITDRLSEFLKEIQ